MDRISHGARIGLLVARLLRGLGIALAIAGFLAAVATWGFMATYADDRPNSLVQNLTPLLVYAAPAWAVALGLFWIARRLSSAGRSPP